jgi:hypothetical protein
MNNLAFAILAGTKPRSSEFYFLHIYEPAFLISFAASVADNEGRPSGFCLI